MTTKKVVTLSATLLLGTAVMVSPKGRETIKNGFLYLAGVFRNVFYGNDAELVSRMVDHSEEPALPRHKS